MKTAKYKCTHKVGNQYMGTECHDRTGEHTIIFYFDKLNIIKVGDSVEIDKDEKYNTVGIRINGETVNLY